MQKIDVAGLKIDSITKQELLKALLKRIQAGKKTFITTPYSEFLYHIFQKPKLLSIFNKADFAVADGIGIFLAKKYLEIPLTYKNYWLKILQTSFQLKYTLASIIFYPPFVKSALPEKIVGADLVWDLARLASENNLSIFLLGGFNNTAELTAKKLTTYNLQLKIAGFSNKNPDDLTAVDDINKSGADILLVAYGPLIQEKWISENLDKLNIKVAIGVGGTFDYIAGVKKTPPKIIRYSGFEWLWRLITQPYRFKRIINATFGIIFGLWRYKVFNSFPLRPNVALVILNSENKVLVGQRGPKDFRIDIISNPLDSQNNNYWQFPQGGIDPREELAKAAKREAFEETGITELELIAISKQTNIYYWNNALRTFWRNRNYKYVGQKQNVVYFRYNGNNSDIKLDNFEFINYEWVDINSLLEKIHKEKQPLAKIVSEDLKNLI